MLRGNAPKIEALQHFRAENAVGPIIEALETKKIETLQHFWCSEAENAVRHLFFELPRPQK